MERGSWCEEISESEEGVPYKNDLSCWKGGIYIGYTRSEEECSLEYTSKFSRHTLLENYARDYEMKFWEEITGNRNERMWLLNKVTFRHLNDYIRSELSVKLRIETSKLPAKRDMRTK